MGFLRMIRPRPAFRAVAGYAVGWIATAIGSGLQWGLGIGLIVGGLACALSFVLFIDIPEGRDGP